MFEGEKYVGLLYKYNLVDEQYPLLVFNDVLVIVDYQDDGSSRGMWRQYWNNPQGFAFLRQEHMRLYRRWKFRWRSSIHYAAHCFRMRKYGKLLETSMPVCSFFMIPFGFLLYMITKYKVRTGAKMSF